MSATAGRRRPCEDRSSRVTLFDPEGKQAATGLTSPKEARAEIAAPVAGQAGKTWSLSIGKAGKGALKDNVLRLDARLPPILSFVPDEVFGLGE